MPQVFARDRVTWVVYVVLGWFAYLQAAPGLVVPHLRDELDLSYSVGGLHVAAFAAGSMAAGVLSAPVEAAIGRRTLLWASAALMGAGTVGLTVGDTGAMTIGSVLVMGLGGGLLLVTVQAVLSDQHGDLRAIALTEANVSASVAYVILIGALSVTAALHLGWRTALLASLVVPLLVWWHNRELTIEAPPPAPAATGRLPRPFWIATGVLVCTTAAEWCVTGWGASFVEEAVGVSADHAVSMMIGYFGGVLVGRILGSRLARRTDPARLLATALAVSSVGFAVLWPATTAPLAMVGLALLGVGIGNLFPMGISLAVSLAPGRAVLAGGRAVTATSFAVLSAPLTVGAVADAASLKAAFLVMPVMFALAGAGLVAVARVSPAVRSSL
jgi:MFS family permease